MATIVLVHGLWSDGSSWARVITELHAMGHYPVAAQLDLETFDGDVAAVRRTLATVAGPVLLAGWSYGGAVIGEAARTHPDVTALAYVAAFAPAEGESVSGLSRRHPGSLIPAYVVVAGDYTYMGRDHFGQVLAADAPADAVVVAAATQRMVRIGLDRVKVGPPAWLDLPSQYLVTTADQAVPPQLQREMAARMGAVATELDSSHTPLLSQPREVAQFLDRACTAAGLTADQEDSGQRAAEMTAGLERFVAAQEDTYDDVKAELGAGHKRSHWMWFVFPQVSGLGSSKMATIHAITSLEEAKAYLAHPVLGSRLRECSRLLLDGSTGRAGEILGRVDAMKLRSSMTLFSHAAPSEDIFQHVLDRFYEGFKDPATEKILKVWRSQP